MKSVSIIGAGITRKKWKARTNYSWSMNRCYKLIDYRKTDRWFDFHSGKVWKQNAAIYRKWKNGPQIIVRNEKKDLEKCIVYPKKQVSNITGNYFSCTVTYMIALAVYEWFDRIELYGIDLSEPQYLNQRPCIEYHIGFARAKGIEVQIPKKSAIFDMP